MKLTKRILSLVLSVLLGIGVSSTAFAGGQAFVPAAGEDLSHLPRVYLSGGWHSLWEDEDWGDWLVHPENSKSHNRFNEAEPFAPEKMQAVYDAIFGLNITALGEGLTALFTEGYAQCAMDKSGRSINPNITCNYMFLRDLDLPGAFGLPEGAGVPISEHLTLYKNQCMFFMDWRLDPWDLADDVHGFLKGIVEDPSNDFERVNLIGVSGSGPVLLSYLARYGTQYLASAVFDMSMHNGSSLFGGIATGNFGLDASALATTKMYSWGKTDLIGKFALPIAVLYQSGLLDAVLKAFNFAAKGAYAKTYEEGLVPYWFYMPFYLCLIPQSQYNQAKRFLFKGNPNGEFDDLIAVADRYHSQVMAKQDEIILKAASEIKLGVRAGYGLPLSPYAKGTNVQSDELVDTVYASMGATTSHPGKPFSPLYRQKEHSANNYISPDRYVDASTCLLPDQTWFAEGFYHYPEWNYELRDGARWLDWFIAAENYTVWDDDRFPQYSKWSRETETDGDGNIIETKNYFTPFEKTNPSMAHNVLDVLNSTTLCLLQLWRWLVMLPLFWM
ncbi:MAG: hypothetical protein FWC27_14455 [Firmicutes bacterium]|nr:hypothetical protein [Bacillota bacterium]